MNSPGPRARLTLGASALAAIAAIAAGCSSSGGSAPTVTVSASASASGQTPSTTPPAPSATSPAPVTAGLCQTSGLRVRAGQANGAAGTTYYNIDFTNTSGATCVLQGYPGVSLVSGGSSAGSQIGADAKRISSPARAISVASGQTAHAVLGIAAAGNFPAASCNPVTAHWLKVFPPGMRAAAYVHFTTQTCASTSQPTMTITTISPGA